MPKNKNQLPLKDPNIFWPCGDETGLGCGQECYGVGVPHVLGIKQKGHRARNVVFCSKCAQKIKEARQ